MSVTAANVMAQTARVSVPRLVVGITIDKLRTDYMDAFAPLYGEDGFKRLLREGKLYSNAQYPMASVDRASSVASLFTGTVPYNHGIVGEEWMDRSTMRPMYCVNDFRCVGVETSDCSSPKNLLVSTVGDELKVATDGKAVIYAIAPYREMAVLSAGHVADWALWIDNNTGLWAGTSYYGAAPSWVKYLNTTSVSNKISSLTWKPANDAIGKYNYYFASDRKSFSHSFTGENRFRKFKNSALVNEEVTNAVRSCLRNGFLGADDITDMMSVCYYAGTFGDKPISECAAELQDTYARLDAEIASLLDEIDKTVGLTNTLIFVTSTGYDDTPEDIGLEKYRIPTGDFEINRCAALLNIYLMAVYGQGQYVESYFGHELYLNHKLLEEKQLNLSDVLDRCEDFLFQFSGVRDVYTSRRLTQGAWTPGINRIRNSYNPKCSGDIFIQVAPGWNLVNEDNASSRMQRDSYLEFPLIFFGCGIKPETIQLPVTVDCIAPTVAHFMRIRAPNACSTPPLFLSY